MEKIKINRNKKGRKSMEQINWMKIKKFIKNLFTKKRSCYNCKGFFCCFPDGYFHGGYNENYALKCLNYTGIEEVK